MTARKKIMLIDDDDAVVRYLVVKLSRMYDVVSTTDPLKAVAVAKRERPDLVLCDIDMPEMSGGEVASALSEDPATAFIPVVYLTALVSPAETRDLSGQVGGRPGVSKRAPLAELMKVIDEMTPGSSGPLDEAA